MDIIRQLRPVRVEAGSVESMPRACNSGAIICRGFGQWCFTGQGSLVIIVQTYFHQASHH